MNNPEIRVRFAPSPTGFLHLGGARVAIFNWLFAKSINGKFLLRIEDTDTDRSKKEYLDAIIDSLEWLGIIPDEQMIIQSEQIAKHEKIIFELLSKGLAYKCYCSLENLSDQRKESDAFAFKYPNTCRDLINIPGDLRPYVIRIKLLNLSKELIFDDLIKGKISVESSILDDFIIVKSNGIPTYNFAVVADDIDMKISHVIRGEDHIINTFKQLELYKILHSKPPLFGHLPMIMALNGERLSKRFGAVSISEFYEQGFLSEAMFNYLVRLGWSHGNQEIFSKEELIKLFSLKNIGIKNAIFDVEKLTWLNSHYLKLLDFDSFLKKLPNSFIELKDYLDQPFRKKILEALFNLYKLRISKTTTLAQTLKQVESNWEFFDKNKIYSTYPSTTINIVKRFLKLMIQNKVYLASEIQSLAKSFAEQEDLHVVSLAKPLRFILIGDAEGPSVFALLEIFGQEYIKTLTEEL